MYSRKRSTLSGLPYDKTKIIKRKHAREALTRTQAIESVYKGLVGPFLIAAERGHTKYKSEAYQTHAYN